MSSGRPFHFKRFSLMHQHSTMKVGTDAVLLGAWADGSRANHILDIGTGCGILSLILAQRYEKAQIVAVDIDPASVSEAKENFHRSPWNQRLKAICSDISTYAETTTALFDLIVSNPPFFTSTFKTLSQRRTLARHTDTLSFDQLAQAVKKIIHPKGTFALVLPADQFDNWNSAARKQSLFLTRIQHIIPIKNKEPNRFNMSYSLDPIKKLQREEFIIREKDGQFTTQYLHQLKDLYLGIE
ncbi:MAG: methyltransferase [Bacteroidales bacterium]|nr:methyltransferase [Bacteroidales bacterium]MCK9448331.1 methyltransferase [Bacteroidales bacterium]MDY0370538.1 methyltransferase [Bacteroidales bacterium]